MITSTINPNRNMDVNVEKELDIETEKEIKKEQQKNAQVQINKQVNHNPFYQNVYVKQTQGQKTENDVESDGDAVDISKENNICIK